MHEIVSLLRKLSCFRHLRGSIFIAVNQLNYIWTGCEPDYLRKSIDHDSDHRIGPIAKGYLVNGHKNVELYYPSKTIDALQHFFGITCRVCKQIGLKNELISTARLFSYHHDYYSFRDDPDRAYEEDTTCLCERCTNNFVHFAWNEIKEKNIRKNIREFVYELNFGDKYLAQLLFNKWLSYLVRKKPKWLLAHFKRRLP